MTTDTLTTAQAIALAHAIITSQFTTLARIFAEQTKSGTERQNAASGQAKSDEN